MSFQYFGYLPANLVANLQGLAGFGDEAKDSSKFQLKEDDYTWVAVPANSGPPVPVSLWNVKDVKQSGQLNIGQALFYDGASWVNQDLPAGIVRVSDMEDTRISAPEPGQVLVYKAGAWRNAHPTVLTSSGLADLTDVQVSEVPGFEQGLKFQGDRWVNAHVPVVPALAIDGGLTDVQVSAPQDGELLVLSASSGKWENQALSPPSTLASLANVAFSTPQDGEALGTNGSSWVNVAVPAAPSVPELTQIGGLSVRSPQAGDMLVFNSDTGYWENRALMVYKLGGLDGVALTDGAEALLKYSALEGWVARALDPEPSYALAQLTDTAVAAPLQNNQRLLYQSGAWVNAARPTVSMGALTDVALSANLAEGEALIFDTGAWKNAPPPVPALPFLAGMADVNLGVLADGDYLSYSAVAGKWTASTPEPVSLGTLASFTFLAAGDVLSFNGSVWVNLSPASPSAPPLSGLGDVSFDDLAAGDVLSFNGSGWVNLSPEPGSLEALGDTAVSNAASGHVLAYRQGWWTLEEPPTARSLGLASLDDVVVSATAVEGQVLMYDAGKWANKPVPSVFRPSLASLADTQITSPLAGDILVYDGAAWKNEPVSVQDGTLAGLADSEIVDAVEGATLVWNSGKWRAAPRVAPALLSDLDDVQGAAAGGQYLSYTADGWGAREIGVTSPGTGEGLYPQSQFDAARVPTANDDSGQGFLPGSMWVFHAERRLYFCTSNTPGAAVWTEVNVLRAHGVFGTSAVSSDLSHRFHLLQTVADPATSWTLAGGAVVVPYSAMYSLNFEAAVQGGANSTYATAWIRRNDSDVLAMVSTQVADSGVPHSIVVSSHVYLDAGDLLYVGVDRAAGEGASSMRFFSVIAIHG